MHDSYTKFGKIFEYLCALLQSSTCFMIYSSMLKFQEKAVAKSSPSTSVILPHGNEMTTNCYFFQKLLLMAVIHGLSGIAT